MPTYRVDLGASSYEVEVPDGQPSAAAPSVESPWPTGADVLRSGKEYIGNTVEAVRHPIQTLQGMGNMALGVAEQVIPGEQPHEPYGDALGQFIQQRYGNFDAARETLKRDPVGMMADASMVLSAGAGAIGKVGEIGKIGQLADVSKVVGTTAKLLDPLQATMEAAKFAGQMPARVAETSLRGAAAKNINSLIKPKNRQFSYGKNPGLAIAQEGIVASNLNELSQKASARMQQLGAQIGTALDIPLVAQKRLNISKAIQPLSDALTNAKKNPRTNAAVIQRLENLRDDLLGVVVNPDGTTTVTRDLSQVSPRQAFDFKRTIGELTKWTDNLSDDTLVNGALKQTYSSVRRSIEGVVPGIKHLNERYGNLLEAANAARNQALTMERRNSVGLLDFMAGTAGMAQGGVDKAFIGVLLSQGSKAAINSPWIRTQLSKWMMQATPTEVEAFFNRVPGLREGIMQQGLQAGTAEQRVTDPTTVATE